MWLLLGDLPDLQYIGEFLNFWEKIPALTSRFDDQEGSEDCPLIEVIKTTKNTIFSVVPINDDV